MSLKVIAVIWTAMSTQNGWNVEASPPQVVEESVCADLVNFYAGRTNKPFHGIGAIRVAVDCIPIDDQESLAKSE